MIVAEVVRSARRRLLWIEIAAQGGFTVCVALAAVVLLLLLGAQILDWRWLIALPAAALALGTLTILRRLPKPYPTAQLVDSRLQLSDALSTALYFSTAEGMDRATEEARLAQRDQALRLSENLKLAEAIPFKAPRVMYPAGALALIAVSLFGLRYGLEHKLDLRPSLAHILKQTLAADVQAAELLKQSEKDASKRGAGRNSPGQDLQDATGNRSAAADAANSAQDNPRGSAERREQTEAKPERQEQADAQPNDEPQDGNGEQNAGDGSKQSQQQRNNQAAGSQSSGQAGEKAGMLSGLRDTMQNLLSTMRRQFGGAGGRQQQASKGQNRNGSNPQKGDGSSQQAGQGKQPGSSESESQAGDAQSGQNGQGRGAGQSSDQQAGNQPGGGIGSQEGSKDMRLAEPAAATGSISRINGQRSPDTNGAVTVEVQSGNQQLSTPYTQKSAGHTNAGGEINRDEVPLLYQSYVQQYFEEVRKERTPVTSKRPGTKPLNR